MLSGRRVVREGLWKRSTFRCYGLQLTLDKTVCSRVWWHTEGSSKRPALDQGWGSSSKTAPRSLSIGSPAGRTPPHGDGSMYSQAYVRVGKCAAAPSSSVAVRDRGHWKGVVGSGWAREKWLHEESVSLERWSPLGAPRNRPEAGEEPEDHKRKQGTREEKFISRHWWIYVILRIRSWNLDIKNTKVELYSEWYCKRQFRFLCSIHWTRIFSISNDSS